LHFYKK
jgi:hypothetical protein